MKIAILNQPLGNRGDEAAHKAFMRALICKFPNFHFDVIFINALEECIEAIKVNGASYINLTGFSKGYVRAEQLGFILNNINISFLHPILSRLKRLLADYNVVICAPGGICMGGFLSWDHIWQLWLAKKLNKTIFYWGRSIGPFNEQDYKHRLFKKYSIELLHYFSFIALRDSKSVQIAQELGIPYKEIVDSAFLEVPEAVVPQKYKYLLNEKYVVVVPNELRWHYRYRNISSEKIDNFHLKIINLLINKFPDSKIVMLPQTYNSIINDYEYFKRLKQKATSNENIIVIDENQNSDIQQKIISKAQLVIGERYHSIVFAINNKVPFISLTYEHKMSGLLEHLGLSEFSVEVQDVFDDGNERSLSEAMEKIAILLKNNQPFMCKENPQAIVQATFDTLCQEIYEQ